MRNVLLITLILFLVSGLVIPQVSFASEHGRSDSAAGSARSDSAAGSARSDSAAGSALGTVDCSIKGAPCLKNPLDKSISSIPAFFKAIIEILMIFAIPFIVFFIIYAGFLYVTARGNAEAIQKAHRALLYALIGGLLILGASLLLDIITGTVNDIVK